MLKNKSIIVTGVGKGLGMDMLKQILLTMVDLFMELQGQEMI